MKGWAATILTPWTQVGIATWAQVLSSASEVSRVEVLAGEGIDPETLGRVRLGIEVDDEDVVFLLGELGLLGAAAVLLVYLLIIERGFKTAMLATDSFSKLLATGLTAVLALQVFVIVGGVTKLIPLTGVTLPFISYGGSSIVANFILLALLLLVSDRARREALEVR